MATTAIRLIQLRAGQAGRRIFAFYQEVFQGRMAALFKIMKGENHD
jgi:hypothetical protein